MVEHKKNKHPFLGHFILSNRSTVEKGVRPFFACCRVCGGAAKVIAGIEDPAVISKILNHLQEKLPLDSAVQIAGFGEGSRGARNAKWTKQPSNGRG